MFSSEAQKACMQPNQPKFVMPHNPAYIACHAVSMTYTPRSLTVQIWPPAFWHAKLQPILQDFQHICIAIHSAAMQFLFGPSSILNSVELYCTLNLWTLLLHLFICISHDCISPHMHLFAHDLLWLLGWPELFTWCCEQLFFQSSKRPVRCHLLSDRETCLSSTSRSTGGLISKPGEASGTCTLTSLALSMNRLL